MNLQSQTKNKDRGIALKAEEVSDENKDSNKLRNWFNDKAVQQNVEKAKIDE
jgi:hypothetical protein